MRTRTPRYASPYGYAYPYAPPPPSYGYAYPPASGSVQPGQVDGGGVSFEITPNGAEVWVDGSYVGTVDEFTPNTAPLALAPGRHRIEIRANGYRTMTFDADVLAGQVVPYRGALSPQT